MLTDKELRAYRSLFPKDTWFEETDGTIRSDNPAIAKVTQAEIDAEIIKLQAEYDALTWKRSREAEYPSTGDQLDYIFHNGVAKWKTDMIEPVKAKYPKPS